MLARCLLAIAGIALPLSAQSGWKLVWSDEFDGTSIDPTKWDYDTGGHGWGNEEWEYYTSSSANSYIEDGKLVIKAMREDFGGRNYTSARMITKGKYSVTYGRIEARIQIPYGQGIWPAFWMLGDDITTVSWPKCGEIDIMEIIGKEPRTVYGTAHMPPKDGGSYSVSQGGKHTLPAAGPEIRENYHVFAVEWEPEEIRWYFDDVLYNTFRKSETPSNATWVFSKPFHLLLNVAVGGRWPQYPDATTVLPQYMRVEYVRVYQREKPAIAAERGVVNGASFQPGIAPGSWLTVAGTGLANTTRTWTAADFSSGVAPTELDGVQVLVGGKPAYLSYISQTQINAIAPDAGAGDVQVEVVRQGERSAAVTARMDAHAPGFFLWQGRYVVAHRHPDWLAVGKPGMFPDLTTRPAKPGDIVILWGTGFGPTDPAVPPGRTVTGAPNTVNRPVIRIGDRPADLISAVLSPGFLGVYQIAITVPALPDGEHSLVAEVAGVRSPAGVILVVAN